MYEVEAIEHNWGGGSTDERLHGYIMYLINMAIANLNKFNIDELYVQSNSTSYGY